MPAVNAIAALSLPVPPTRGSSRSAGDSEAFSQALDRIQNPVPNPSDQKRSSPRNATPAPVRSSSETTGKDNLRDQEGSEGTQPLADEAISSAMPDKVSLKATDETSEPLEPEHTGEAKGPQIAGPVDPALTAKGAIATDTREPGPQAGKAKLDALATQTVLIGGDNASIGQQSPAEAAEAAEQIKALTAIMKEATASGTAAPSALVAAGSAGLAKGLSANLALSALPRKLDPAVANLVQSGSDEGTAETAGTEPGPIGAPLTTSAVPAAHASAFSLANTLPGLAGALTSATSHPAETKAGSQGQGEPEPGGTTMGAQLATQIAAQSGAGTHGVENPSVALAAAAGVLAQGSADTEISNTSPSIAGTGLSPTSASDADITQASFVSGPSLAAIETTAQLALQIARRVEGRTTRFEMALTPEGLGRVDVSLDIDADGALSARLAFDNPAAATELRGRADELRRQLQEAGFNVGSDSLSFSEREAGSSGGGSDRRFEREAGRAFAGASRLNDEIETSIPPPQWASPTQTPQGVDLKV